MEAFFVAVALILHCFYVINHLFIITLCYNSPAFPVSRYYVFYLH